jgi:hypothetical protein
VEVGASTGATPCPHPSSRDAPASAAAAISRDVDAPSQDSIFLPCSARANTQAMPTLELLSLPPPCCTYPPPTPTRTISTMHRRRQGPTPAHRHSTAIPWRLLPPQNCLPPSTLRASQMSNLMPRGQNARLRLEFRFDAIPTARRRRPPSHNNITHFCT